MNYGWLTKESWRVFVKTPSKHQRMTSRNPTFNELIINETWINNSREYLISLIISLAASYRIDFVPWEKKTRERTGKVSRLDIIAIKFWKWMIDRRNLLSFVRNQIKFHTDKTAAKSLNLNPLSFTLRAKISTLRINFIDKTFPDDNEQWQLFLGLFKFLTFL